VQESAGRIRSQIVQPKFWALGAALHRRQFGRACAPRCLRELVPSDRQAADSRRRLVRQALADALAVALCGRSAGDCRALPGVLQRAALADIDDRNVGKALRQEFRSGDGLSRDYVKD
jgi:hypothetical protein